MRLVSECEEATKPIASNILGDRLMDELREHHPGSRGRLVRSPYYLVTTCLVLN